MEDHVPRHAQMGAWVLINDRWYYGTILTASHCGASRRGPGTRPRAVVCWRWPRSTIGGSRTDASRIGGVGLQIIRDWVLRFNARGPDGLVDGKSPGAPSKLNADHRRALAEVVEAGPVPAVDGVVRWRRKDLARWLLETFAISLDETTVGRELKALGFAKISARPRHYAQNELAVEAFKKNFPAELAKIRARLPKGVEIELWWQDEARIGQKNKLTRRWARRGTRPRAPRDQRTEWAYIFGAICPAKGKGAGLVMPWCDTDAMAAHLIEISAAVDPGAHAVLIVDQAGWHLTPKLAIPDNITVLALPPRSPELNPVENVWQFMRDNWLSNRIFKSYEDIVALCCQAWNNLIDPTMEDHVPRHAQMGAWVLINDRWYQARRHHRHGRGQPLPQGGLPATTQRPLSRPRPRTGAPPSSPSPARSTTSCASTRNAPSQTTTRCATSAWHFRSPPAATAAITSRPGSASTNTPTAQWPSSMDRDVWRDTTPMANRSTAKPARPRDPLRRDRPAPCGQVDSRSATDHFPTGPETATEAVNSYGT